MYLPRLKRTLVVPSLAALATILALGTVLCTVAHAAARPETRQVGAPFTGSMGISRTTGDIMLEESLHAGEPVSPPMLMREHEIKGLVKHQSPDAARVASIPSMPAQDMVYRPKGLPNQINSPQTIGVNVTAATLATTGAFPPDCDGSVGPTQYVVGVNGRIISLNKTTGLPDGVLNTSTNTFFTSVRAGSGTSDPMVRYDRLSNRWFISIINVSTPNRWLLGVSDAASNGVISGSTVWTYYFFIPATTSPTISNGSTCLSDYPSLGIDANALYTGVSEFCGTGQPFQQTDVFVIRKSSVLTGGPIVVTAFRALMTATGGYVGPWSARGVDNYDPTSNEGYFLSADGASWGGMILNRIANPGGVPSISSNITIAAPAGAGPRPVPHPSNGTNYWGRLDPLDDRYYSVHIRNQQLWAANNLGVNNLGVSNDVYLQDTRVGSRWYQVNVPVNTGTPTIVQSGTVFATSGANDSLQKSYFIPSIMVSGQGHVAMSVTTAGETNNANCEAVGRLVGDPTGTMQAPTPLTTNTNTYLPSGDPGGISAGRPRRWGDYSITSLDPLDDMSMWTVNMFCDANNSYGVRVARLLAPLPATPSSMPDVGDGQVSVSVTLTGTASSGSGFFDPGPDLASPERPFTHVSATCTNGAATGTPPTVVSATYTDPTHLQIVLNTSSATPNIGVEKYTINVTNPDGQTSSAAVVHVIQSNFTITATAGAGGSISPSGAVTVVPGGSQSFTIAADGCHNIGDVIVDGVSQGAVASYSFTNVTANHTITASFTAQTRTITASAGPGGSITPSGAVLVSCGSNQPFMIGAASCFYLADVVVDGVSRGPVSSYNFTNVTVDHTITASFTAGINQVVTGLSASQVKLGNDTDGTTKITVTFTAPPIATSVEVWRKGFGSYPTYDNGGGSVPPTPGSYPPAGWALTGVTASGQTDEPPTRDFWYYVAYAKDACADASAPSNLTGGTLDYHLGDASDGVTPGAGDNTVNTADASLIGMHYGASGVSLIGFEYLDWGPTTDLSTNARPSTDGVVDFEDLIVLSINYTPNVSLVAKGGPMAQAFASDGVTLQTPDHVAAGDVFEVPIELTGSGRLQAMSVSLRWDAGVVEPVSMAPGTFITDRGGMVLSPGAGRADAALLGVGGEKMAGQGVIATATFRAIKNGDPGVAFARVIGRDAANKAVTVSTSATQAARALASETQLHPAIPNPARGAAILSYSIARDARVDLAIYSVDGRRLKTLAGGEQAAGAYRFTWDGTDTHGSAVRSGVYFVRLDVGGHQQSRLLTWLK